MAGWGGCRGLALVEAAAGGAVGGVAFGGAGGLQANWAGSAAWAGGAQRGGGGGGAWGKEGGCRGWCDATRRLPAQRSHPSLCFSPPWSLVPQSPAPLQVNDALAHHLQALARNCKGEGG